MGEKRARDSEVELWRRRNLTADVERGKGRLEPFHEAWAARGEELP